MALMFFVVQSVVFLFPASRLAGAGLAGGIALELVNTAFGLFVAIPSYIFHRYYRGRVDELVADLERQAAELAESLVHLSEQLQRGRAVRRA